MYLIEFVYGNPDGDVDYLFVGVFTSTDEIPDNIKTIKTIQWF